MQASHDLSRVAITFDEPNLVSHAGLIAPAELAQRLGVAKLINERVDLVGAPGRANIGVKAMTMIAGMLAGADARRRHGRDARRRHRGAVRGPCALHTGELPALVQLR